MRLAQLARKIGRTQSDIVTFLATLEVTVLEESNARIEEEHTLLVTQHFAPELLNVIEEEIADEEVLTPIISIEPTQEINVNETHLPMENSFVETHNEQITEGTIELIKAPKIELQGLKVIGKIELPETKKKASEETKETKVQSVQNLSKNRNSNTERKTYKNPVELQREREAKENDRKKKEQAAYEKELRTQRYLTKVRKPSDIYKEPREKVYVANVKRTEPKKKVGSTSLIARFFSWMAGGK